MLMFKTISANDCLNDNNEFPHKQSMDQARGQIEWGVFLIFGRSFCPSFILAYIIYTFKRLPLFRTGRSLILQGDYFSLVSLLLDPSREIHLIGFLLSIKGHFHIKLEVQKMQFLGLISSQNKIYCSILHLHSKHMVVFYKW